MHPSLLLLRKLVEINLDSTDDSFLSLTNTFASIVWLTIKHLNFECVLGLLDVKSADLVPHGVVRLRILFGVWSITFHYKAHLGVRRVHEYRAQVPRIYHMHRQYASFHNVLVLENGMLVNGRLLLAFHFG